jgi:hypothetical protein
VEYVLNGSVLASQTSVPYGLDLQAGDVPEGSVMEIRVYNKSGKLAVSKSFSLSSQVSVNIDGKDQSFAQPPVIINGNTMAPLRAIFEAMGAIITYDHATRTVTAVKGDTTLKLTIGQKIVTKNGKSIELEEAAQLVNSNTMVPARFVGEAFDGSVSWDGKTRTVSVKTTK